MQIPMKVDYGVRALVDLAMQGCDSPVRASDIASRAMIPESYLAQVLHALGKAGIVKSQRGPQGGHTLALAPEDIRLSAVMTCLGTAENLVFCLDDSAACAHAPSCAQRELWNEVELAVYGILDSRTIAHLVDRSREITRAKIVDRQPAALANSRN